jgi:hypothetical protein
LEPAGISTSITALTLVCDRAPTQLNSAITSARTPFLNTAAFMVANSIFGRLADCKSAIRQIKNLRYSTAMSQVAGVCE